MATHRRTFASKLREYAAGVVAALREARMQTIRRPDAPRGYHALRVAVKQIRVIAQMIDALIPDAAAREATRTIDPLFRAAGKVRDLHVQRRLVQMWPERHSSAVEAYDAHLAKKLEKSTRMYQKQARHGAGFPPPHADRHAPMLEGTFVAHLKEILHALPRRVSSRDDLHALRRVLKDAGILVAIGRNVLPPRIAPRRMLATRLDTLQKLLGDWHDADVAIGMLHARASKHPRDARTLTAIGRRLARENRDRVQRVRSVLPQLQRAPSHKAREEA